MWLFLSDRKNLPPANIDVRSVKRPKWPGRPSFAGQSGEEGGGGPESNGDSPLYKIKLL